ncbi:MAG TPA: NADP-dependent oxidoreductase [Desulfomonilaceae bacterium]|nr:NADP-dependent oxidoreductase [Desulfomonilaceae bacterium]
MREISASHESELPRLMKAVCIRRFGGFEVIMLEGVCRPTPSERQMLIRVKAAGVGPWDAWVREGKSALPQPLPLILGSDLSGVVEDIGPGVFSFHPGDEVFGVTNSQFIGAYAEYAVVDVAMIARKPTRLSYVEAASVPVVASTAWQMVFDHGQVDSTKRVLVHGAAGNVGAYAVQFAKIAEAEVIATVSTRHIDYVRTLGVDRVIDVQRVRFEDRVEDVDVVIDTIGGETLDRSFAVLKVGGVLVSSVSMPDQEKAAHRRVRGVFFLVAVTSEVLHNIADLLDSDRLRTNVGEVLPLSEARLAHEMLAGKPHKRGKIVLTVHV